jgi:two-component system, LytTR family, sensor kinase
MKKNNKPIFWLSYHLGLLIFAFLVAVIMKYNQTGKALVPETILVTAVIFTMSVIIGYLAIFMVNMAARLPHSELNKKLLPAFILFLSATFIIANLVVSLGVFVWYFIKHYDLTGFFTHLIRNELTYANRSLFVWLLFFSIVFFYTLWKKSSEKETKLREENLKYRYKTLKAQVNPHFLFNSLNTLSELVHEDAEHAESYIQKLSGVYRYVLDNEETELIQLEDEINFVLDYFNLQMERNRDKIALTIDIKDMEDCKIVPVSLQLLIENAIKHNSYSTKTPLKINIIRQGDYLKISNNIQRKNSLENSAKTGLQNLAERVFLIMGKKLVTEETNNEFVVKMPIIQLSK